MRKTVFELIREHKAAVQETPCIVVDTETAKKNICRMQEAVSACGCKLRPHIKTHKIPYLPGFSWQQERRESPVPKSAKRR